MYGEVRENRKQTPPLKVKYYSMANIINNKNNKTDGKVCNSESAIDAEYKSPMYMANLAVFNGMIPQDEKA